MSVDILRDSANTRSQQRGGFKGEGYFRERLIMNIGIKYNGDIAFIGIRRIS
ncbi:hypothetical protein [Candidatus Regiella endosymbiont of Tuberolachnus salignus]|uniref:hypothetical protein n=1 Tax=Candidatus Regiella endosymbiont of Tuberolachnus salignus TaxID=3077956 RepID=UPI0030D0B2AC